MGILLPALVAAAAAVVAEGADPAVTQSSNAAQYWWYYPDSDCGEANQTASRFGHFTSLRISYTRAGHDGMERSVVLSGWDWLCVETLGPPQYCATPPHCP